MSKPGLRKKFVAACLGVVITAGPLFTLSSAHGDPIADKQKQAQEIADKLSALQHQVEDASNQYEAAQEQLQTLDAQIQEQQGKVDQAQSQAAADRQELAKYAVNAYVTGGSNNNLTGLVGTATDQIGQRQGYTHAAMGDRQQLVDNLEASQKDAQDQVDRLNRQRKQAQEASAKAKAAKDSAEQGAAQYQALQNQVQGELQQLVAQKQAAEQAAAEQRAFAAAQAQAQSQAAASGSGGSAGGTHGGTAVAIPARPSSGGGGRVAPPSSAPASGAGGRAVAAAETQLGVPYLWGGESPGRGMDCSGLTQWAWAQAGVSIPRTTYEQIGAGRQVSISDIQPGDLVFYYGTGHVAMYVGGGTVIHAPHTGTVVQYASLYMSTPEAVVRP